MPYYYGFDRTYILVIIGIIITMIAQANVQRAFSKYSKIQTKKHITGKQTADYILSTRGYDDITIKRINNAMGDYFNPATKEVALSPESINDSSIASVAVAAHELGHVIQYKEGYTPLRVKSWLVPAVNFGSRLSMPILLIGMFLARQNLIDFGLILFALTLVFQIVTLPVEFNASRRALAVLEESGMLVGEENQYAAGMLKAAAFTYVAATLATALQFLRMFLLFGNRNRD
ncbi:zinc metallopeptidase [Anaerococcus sp. mt242]|uniref:zinc metallopeptidase n=1 Tax=Anaerococcus sp. mt242 TaxID=2661917 RepID=UPI0019312CE5|nr:zinc metallopeptidase [Anaerococcus sp. mt242]MBM0046099.1 zinc metallopeptidase [Anaerococcus sp. mt242]